MYRRDRKQHTIGVHHVNAVARRSGQARRNKRKLERTNAFSSQQNVIEAHEYAEKLYDINVRTKVEWVPSHSDIQHNEIVDKLAKEATTITDNVEDTEYVSHVKRNARATT